MGVSVGDDDDVVDDVVVSDDDVVVESEGESVTVPLAVGVAPLVTEGVGV